MPKHDEPKQVKENEGGDLPVVELVAETLRGDVRNSMLDWFKAQAKAFAFMTEAERRDLANALDRYSFELVKAACRKIAAAERPCLTATLTEYKEKGGIEAKLKLASAAEVVAGLHEAVGQEVLLVTSGFDLFSGERQKAEETIPPDQGDLGIGEEYAEQ